jgi:putative hemolysin
MTHRKSVVFLPLYSNKAKIKECMLKSYIHLSGMARDYDDIVGVVDLHFLRILMMKISICRRS